MPANLITLAHFSVSPAMRLPKSAGEPGKHRAAQVGEPRLDLRIGQTKNDFRVKPVDDLGRRLTARRGPCQELASKPGKKSPTVGKSGSVSDRTAVVTAKGRSFPALMYSIDVPKCEVYLHLPRDEVGYRRRVTAIRDMHHVDIGHHLE